METNANTITTMGIIADEVYKKDYFNGDLTIIEGTHYKVLDHTPASNQGFNALLLQEEETTGDNRDNRGQRQQGSNDNNDKSRNIHESDFISWCEIM